jgi:hypothetical protein
MKITTFRDIVQCSLVEADRRFCLHLPRRLSSLKLISADSLVSQCNRTSSEDRILWNRTALCGGDSLALPYRPHLSPAIQTPPSRASSVRGLTPSNCFNCNICFSVQGRSYVLSVLSPGHPQGTWQTEPRMCELLGNPDSSDHWNTRQGNAVVVYPARIWITSSVAL